MINWHGILRLDSLSEAHDWYDSHEELCNTKWYDGFDPEDFIRFAYYNAVKERTVFDIVMHYLDYKDNAYFFEIFKEVVSG